jgi:hypothetical protein
MNNAYVKKIDTSIAYLLTISVKSKSKKRQKLLLTPLSDLASTIFAKHKVNKMQKTNLITAALSGAALALLFIGAAENIFNLTEVLIGGAVCCAAFVYSISRG